MYEKFINNDVLKDKIIKKKIEIMLYFENLIEIIKKEIIVDFDNLKNIEYNIPVDYYENFVILVNKYYNGEIHSVISIKAKINSFLKKYETGLKNELLKTIFHDKFKSRMNIINDEYNVSEQQKQYNLSSDLQEIIKKNSFDI